MQTLRSNSSAQTQIQVNSFIRSVYNWMATGLALTGLVSYAVFNSPALFNLIFRSHFVYIGLIIAELGFVIYLSARINKLKASTATALFLIYAALNGATLSAIFAVYAHAVIVNTFFVCAATFGACSVYGMVTKKDLTGVGNFMMMGLIGIIIASFANFFIRSSAMGMIINYIGVLVFVGLTAYDTQKIKNMALTQPSDLDGGTVRKGAIMGALALYLDFINMFLFLLRIFGGRD